MKNMNMKKAKNILMLIWLVLSGFMFIILFIQTIGGSKYGNMVNEVWAWFLPLLMPSLTLIVSSVVAEATGLVQQKTRVNSTIFIMALSLSSLYLLSLLVIVLLTFVDQPIALMQRSSIALGPLQGLVSSSIGIFFISSK
jgi:hypothetical protein